MRSGATRSGSWNRPPRGVPRGLAGRARGGVLRARARRGSRPDRRGRTAPGVVIATDRLDRLFRPGLADAGSPLDADSGDPLAQDDPAVDPRLVAWCGASLPGSGSRREQARLERAGGARRRARADRRRRGDERGRALGRAVEVIEAVRVLEADGDVHDAWGAPLASSRPGGTGRTARAGGRSASDRTIRSRSPRVAGEYLLEKRASQPVTESSAGCVFKNPDPELSDGRSAGKLIGGVRAARGSLAAEPSRERASRQLHHEQRRSERRGRRVRVDRRPARARGRTDGHRSEGRSTAWG